MSPSKFCLSIAVACPWMNETAKTPSVARRFYPWGNGFRTQLGETTSVRL